MISFSFAARISSTFLEKVSTSFWINPSVSLTTSSDNPSFWYFFRRSTPSRRALRMLMRAFSPSALDFFTRSLRRSSVSGGTMMRMISPLFCGVNPRLAAIMAFSMAGMRFFSQG
jgi:hypothetical protein